VSLYNAETTPRVRRRRLFNGDDPIAYPNPLLPGWLVEHTNRAGQFSRHWFPTWRAALDHALQVRAGVRR